LRNALDVRTNVPAAKTVVARRRQETHPPQSGAGVDKLPADDFEDRSLVYSREPKH
jgi:hypothetical protein